MEQRKHNSQKTQHDSSKTLFHPNTAQTDASNNHTPLIPHSSISPTFSEIVFEDVSLGFNDGYKERKWAPLNIIIRSQNEPNTFTGKLTVEVRNLNSDEPIYQYATPLQLSKTDRKHKKLYIYCPKNDIKLSAQLVPRDDSEQSIQALNSNTLVKYELTPQTPIKNSDYFVLVLAPSGDKIAKFADKMKLKLNETQDEDETQDVDKTQTHVRYLPNSRAMPTQWAGYSAVDLLIIREASLTDRRISTSQQNALLNWVQQGGTLLLSGGGNYQYLQGSFLEQYLPVKLIRDETMDSVPPILKQQFGLDTTSKPDDGHTPYKNIYFEPKKGCQTLIGTDDQIYIAKRNFGSGQIICLAFDYNAPPFSNLKAGETFWRWFLTTHGKSPKRFADKYAPYREHEEKINELFLAKMPTQVPLIKLLAIILPLYLIGCGGIVFYVGKRNSSPRKRMLRYWIGTLIIVLVSVSAIGFARVVLPKDVEIDMFSILTIYPEKQNAPSLLCWQTYISLRSFAYTETSITLHEDNVIRPLLNEGRTQPAEFYQNTQAYLERIIVEPWSPSTYVYNHFFTADTQLNEMTLENTWIIKGEKAVDLGTITIGKDNRLLQKPLNEIVKKIPPTEELAGKREKFAKILQQEGLFLYLSKPENLLNTDDIKTRTILIGWHQGATPISQEGSNKIVDSETFVIMYLDSESN